jgi:hypothetical protein
MREKVVAIGAIEHPQNIQVRKTLDVLETRLVLRHHVQHTLSLVLSAEAFRDLTRLREWATHEADGFHRVHQIQPYPR